MDLGSRSFSARALVLLVLATAAVFLGAAGTATAAPITMIGGPPSTITQEATGPVTTVYFDHPTATANGNPVTVNCAPASGSQFPLGFSYGGTCVAFDAPDFEIQTFIVEIVDTTPPTFTPVSYIGPFEATNPSGAAPNWPLPTANDLVDSDVEVTCSPAPGEYLPLGFSNVDCTAEDDSGNSTSTSFIAVVEDNTPPVFEPLSNIGPIEISSPTGEVVTWPDPVANDLVDTSVAVSCSPESGSTFSLGTQSVNCTATDDSFNSTSAWFEVEVVDTVGPVFSNIPSPGTFEAEDQFGAYADFDLPTAYDDGAGEVYVSCDNPPGTYPIGQYTVNCEATDSRSNTSFTSFSFEVEDSTAPSFVGVPTAPVVVQTFSSAGATVDFDFLSVTDAVDQDVDLNCSPPSGTIFSLGTTQVNCQASDDAGNNSQATFDVQVQLIYDDTPPELSGVPDDIVAEATGPSGAAVSFTLPTAVDGVDGSVPVDCSPSSSSTFALGETIVTCSAEDAAGHETTATFTVTVEDTTGPTFAGVSGPITLEATEPSGASVSYSLPTANDLVDGAVSVTCDPESGSTFAIATTQVTCTAEDSRGNENTASFDVTVEDTTDPVFGSYPSFQNVDATGPSSPLGYTLPSATDVADDDVEVECTPEPSATYVIPDNAGINEGVTCTATDDSGNDATLSFSVFLADYSDPVLSDLPEDMTVEATGPAGAVITYTPPTALDAVDGSTSVSCSPSSGTTLPIGTHMVQCESGDNSNNYVDAAFQVQVVDTTAPTFVGPPGDITAEATGPLGAVVAIPVFGATDLVDGSITPDCTGPTPPYPVGTTTITCVAEDSRGNESQVEFDINVVDTTAPTITGVPTDISVPATSAAGAPVSYPLPMASDIVDGNVPVACTPAPGSVFAIGTTTVNCTATDAHGQGASRSFKVTVQPQVIDLSETFQIVSAKIRRKNRLVVTVDVPTAGQLEVIATNRRPRSGAVASVLKPGPGRDKQGRAVLDLEKSGRYGVTLRIDARKAGLVKGKRNPLLRVTARFKLPTGEVKHRVVFVRLK